MTDVQAGSEPASDIGRLFGDAPEAPLVLVLKPLVAGMADLHDPFGVDGALENGAADAVSDSIPAQKRERVLPQRWRQFTEPQGESADDHTLAAALTRRADPLPRAARELAVALRHADPHLFQFDAAATMAAGDVIRFPASTQPLADALFRRVRRR